MFEDLDPLATAIAAAALDRNADEVVAYVIARVFDIVSDAQLTGPVGCGDYDEWRDMISTKCSAITGAMTEADDAATIRAAALHALIDQLDSLGS